MTRRIGEWWRSHKGKIRILGWPRMAPWKEFHSAHRNEASCRDWTRRGLSPDHRSALTSAEARKERGRSE
jgi:hypothetical protein